MKMIMMPCVATILLGIIAVISGCGSNSIDPGNKDRMFLFGMRNDPEGKEDFVAVSSDNSVIAAVNGQLAKPVDERTLHINGIIERGNGGHNLGWGWHFTPNRWALAEVSMELCDGNSTLVEQDIAYWVDTVGRYCPWASYVKSEITTGAVVSSFEDCAAAGYPVMESYPRQCRTPDGRLFVEAVPPQSVVPEKPAGDSDIVCTMEARQCPDGTYVGRIPPDCEFAPCPGEKAQ